jgi:carbon monoxide dehydrogenase subunit G
MLIAQDFTVPMPPAEALDLLIDLPRIALCMPGATLTSSDGAIHRGRVKVKVGPIMLIYQGEAQLAEVNRDLNTALLIARGSELKGSGKVSAQIGLRLQEETGATRVYVEATLDITGRLAQFGRSAISDVSGVLIGQFVANLTRLLSPDADAGDDDMTGTAEGIAATPAMPAQPAATPDLAEHIDLLAVSRGAILQRAQSSQVRAAILSALALMLVLRLARRRGRRR